MASKDKEVVLAIAHLIASYLGYMRFAMFLFWRQHYGRSYKERLGYSMKEKIPKQVDYVEGLVSDYNNTSQENLRLSRDAFGRLCILLENYAGLRPSKYVSIPEMLSIFLGILAHHKKSRVQKHDFKRSTWTISKHFHSVLLAVLTLHEKLLVKPQPINSGKFRFFEECLGALDGTYIDVRVREEDKPRYRNRKGSIATNVLGVCDQDMNFIYVLGGWEGSAADGRVLRDALSRENGFRVRRGHYYLADNGYTNCEGFLTPYRGVRYHLKEWDEGTGAPQNAKEYFNMRHSSARNVIERAWGLMKTRWGILRSPCFYPIETQNRIVLACALLHNFIRSEMSADPWESEVPEGFQNPDATLGESIQDDFISSVDNSPAWSAWRDQLATAIYNEWRNTR